METISALYPVENEPAAGCDTGTMVIKFQLSGRLQRKPVSQLRACGATVNGVPSKLVGNVPRNDSERWYFMVHLDKFQHLIPEKRRASAQKCDDSLSFGSFASS